MNLRLLIDDPDGVCHARCGLVTPTAVRSHAHRSRESERRPGAESIKTQLSLIITMTYNEMCATDVCLHFSRPIRTFFYFFIVFQTILRPRRQNTELFEIEFKRISNISSHKLFWLPGKSLVRVPILQLACYLETFPSFSLAVHTRVQLYNNVQCTCV